MGVVDSYLDLIDTQREEASSALLGLSHDQVWRRPAPKEWCIGEILNHIYLLSSSTFPYVKFTWKSLRWFGNWRRLKPYQTDIPDLYRDGKFPMWVGFLWTPRHTPWKPVQVEALFEEMRDLHEQVRDFYTDKAEDLLGHIYLFDPYFGFLNLIVTLRLGAYHDQLHFDDVLNMAETMRK